jgi:hypothetical protein
MRYLKEIIFTTISMIGILSLSGCGGGEADYSFDQVVEAQKLANVEDLIQGDIDFVTKDNMYVDQTSSVVTTIKADTTENLLYSIVGGTDAALFKIDERTGEVSFISTPTYDPNGSNVYEVIVGAKTPSDELSTLHLQVTVVEDITQVDPIIDFVVTSIDAIGSSDVITQIQARPANESDYLRFSVVGQDAGNFSIDNEGNLVFKTPLPDFGSTPNKVYTIAVEIMDGNGNVTTTAPITVTLVGNRDLIRPIVESSSFSVVENALGNMQIDVSTQGTGVVTTYILSGDDSSEFTVDGSGVIKFNVAKDFELNNNSYNIMVQVKDDKGNVSDLKPVVINVVDIDEGYTFESIADVTLLSGTQTVTRVSATSNVLSDVTRKYLLNNYQDIFSIDDNGNISFISPAVAGTSYDVTILAESYISGTQDLINGSQTISASFNVSVVQNPSLIAPTISSGYATTMSVTAPIDTTTPITTVSASFGTGSDATSLSYTTVGEDAGLFDVDSSGVVTFKSAITYIVGGDNIYKVAVEVKDNNNNVTTTDIITVELLQDPSEIAPVIDVATYSTPENSVGTMNISTTTAGSGSVESFAIVGGADAGFFDIDTVSGRLSFKTAPDFESVTHTNIYKVEVSATDSNGNASDTVLLTITVSDVDEKLTFNSLAQFNSVENSQLIATVSASSTVLDSVITYSVVSTIFTIDAQSGVLHFKAGSTPTFDTTPKAQNSYAVQVTAQSQYNGSTTLSPTITVTVLPQDRSISWSVTAANLSIFNPDGSVYLNQESTTDINVIATSSVNPIMLYSIECDTTSTCNVDINTPIFSINPNSGLMRIDAPGYIYSADPEDNTYRATVFVVADDGFSTTDSLAGVMHVNYIDGTPTFNSSTNYAVYENSKVVGTVTATLPTIVGSSLEYFIDGGADASLFTINKTTGELSFWNAPDYENPQDSGSNNVYDVTVRVKDVKTQNTLNTATQQIQVTINNVDESISFVNIADFSVTKDSTVTKTLSATSAAGYAITYSVQSGYDSEIFVSIDNATDVLSVTGVKFILYLFFNPNYHTFTIKATDPFGNTATQNIEVRVRS